MTRAHFGLTQNAEDPAKKGICSNFLCDAKPGDEVTMTGEQPSRAWSLNHLLLLLGCCLADGQCRSCRCSLQAQESDFAAHGSLPDLHLQHQTCSRLAMQNDIAIGALPQAPPARCC